MLNPEQVGRLRLLLAAGHDVRTCDDYQLRTEDVSRRQVDTKPDIIYETPYTNGRFYGPERTFGTPIDAACLDGIGDWTVDFPSRQLQRILNAKIIGNTAVLGMSGALYSPDFVDSAESVTQALLYNASDHQGFILRWSDEDGSVTFVSDPQPSKIRLNALFFHNIEPGNYGSFLIQ